MNEYHIIDQTWRTGNMGAFGIVAVQREVGGWKAYLGSATDSWDERVDAQRIAAAGAPLMEAEARAFFPQLKNLPYAY